MGSKEGLTASKRIYDLLDGCEKNQLDLTVAETREGKKCARKANACIDQLRKEVEQLQRELHDYKTRARAEKDVLRAEVHGELVDREANAARVAERQRFLFERSAAQMGQSSAGDRAAASAAFVEAALVTLCPHPQQMSAGCEQLT